jgi:hypothetical protein
MQCVCGGASFTLSKIKGNETQKKRTREEISGGKEREERRLLLGSEFQCVLLYLCSFGPRSAAHSSKGERQSPALSSRQPGSKIEEQERRTVSTSTHTSNDVTSYHCFHFPQHLHNTKGSHFQHIPSEGHLRSKLSQLDMVCACFRSAVIWSNAFPGPVRTGITPLTQLPEELRPGEMVSFHCCSCTKERKASFSFNKAHLPKNIIITGNHTTLRHRVRDANAKVSKGNLKMHE